MDRRPLQQLEVQYRVEKELARRLLEASPTERGRVYGDVYDELFRRIPDHPQLLKDPEERTREVEARLRFLARFLRPEDCLMEIGAGDCAFSRRAASLVRRVIAVDVSAVITGSEPPCENLEVVLSDGTSIPVRPGSVDVAFSDQLMEHLHPDDAIEQLANVCQALRPGGTYVCITPNRCTGPHDISRFFDDVASGFHLREYGAADLDRQFRQAGFTRVRYYAGGRGHYVRVPGSTLRWAEAAFTGLPRRLRLALRDSPLALALFGVNVVATK